MLSPRLHLRPFTLDDLEAFHSIVSDPVTMQHWPRPFRLDDSRGWIERSMAHQEQHGFGRYAVIDRKSGKLIGDCGLIRKPTDGEETNDLGYIFAREFWGRGLATEAAATVCVHAFTSLNLETLHANMAHDNHASRRVAEKLGMTRVREFVNPKNRDFLTYLYRIDRA